MSAPRRAWRKYLPHGLMCSVVMVAAWMAWLGGRLFIADWMSMEPRYRISAWSSGAVPWSPIEWSRIHTKMRTALQMTPKNPVLHDYMGSLYALRGRIYWDNQVLRRAFYLDARRHQVTSLRLRSVNGRAWSSLAYSMYALDEPDEMLIYAVRQARRYAPHDPQVQKVLIGLLFSRWRSIPNDLQLWVQQMKDDPKVNNRMKIDQMAKSAGIRLP